MAPERRRAVVGVTLALCCALVAAGCAPPLAAPPGPAPAPRSAAPLGDAERAALAEILRMEDARSYEPQRLASLAASASAPVRARTALALGRLGQPQAAPLLRGLLSDPDSSVSATAAFALGLVADTGAVPALAALLAAATRDRPSPAGEAAAALGKIRTASAESALLSFLATVDPASVPAEVAGQALLAIWSFPRSADLGPLTPWAASPDPEVRWRATYALIRRPDPRAVPLLLSLAADPDPRVRSLALRGLGAPALDSARIARTEGLRLLYPALRDADYTVRINAARTLGGFAAAEAVDRLRSLLRSTDRHLALAAIESLGRIGTGAATSAGDLEALVTSDTAQLFVRQSALEALALVAPARARSLAREFSGHPSWRMRSSSARVLALEGATGAVALRVHLADPDPRVAGAALQGAVDAAGDSLAPLRALLVEQLGARDPFLRTTALGALARLRDPATLPLLLDAYGRAQRDSADDAALAALDALAALRTERMDPARTFFARFPRSPDYLVRRKAAQLFPDAAATAWGDPSPVETGRALEVYRSLVDRWGSASPGAAYPEVIVTTDQGVLRLRLFGQLAPLTVESFLSLAARGYFDGQEWPRVVPNFVVQGGDPRGDTNGGPGYALRDELNRGRYLAGTLGMALSGPDTGGSQFFITHSPQPHLDGIYTVFGQLTAGEAVLQRLLPGDVIRSVRLAQ